MLVQVAEALRVAAVGPGDVVLDIGFGDGCVCLAAAKLGARAVGWEIDVGQPAQPPNERARRETQKWTKDILQI